MARLRTIKPGFFTNDQLGECSPLARLLFAGLWCHADRAGRLEDRPKRLKVEVLPYDDCDIEALLGELVAGGFIVRYVAGGARYIAIPTWLKHQNPHIKEAESTIPAPSSTGENGAEPAPAEGVRSASTVQAPYKHSSSRAGLVIGDLSLGSGLGSGGGVAPDADAPDAPLAPQSITVYQPTLEPTSGEHRALWDAFTDVFGEARGKTEKQRRGEACKRSKEAHATPDEIRTAAQNWPNVMGDATLTELGMVANLGKLLHGPQVNGRSKGVTVGMHHQGTQKTSLRASPEDELAQAMRGRR
jgi:hypothetical protein